MKISTKLPADQGLAEIYQSCKLKMALLRKVSDDEFERITPFVMCRDFLTDVFSYSTAKKDFAIYGMKFHGSKESADFSGVYLLLAFPDDKTQQELETNLVNLNEVELTNGMSPSSLTKVDKFQYVLQGHVGWVQNCILFSLYTLLIRSFCNPIPKKKDWIMSLGKIKDNTDSALIASVNPSTWKKIFENLSSIHTKEFCGFDPTKADIGTIHHNSGFISVFGQHREITWRVVRNNSHWQEMKERGFEMHPNSLDKAA